MPRYSYQCPVCQSFTEEARTVAMRDAASPCQCGEQRKRLPSVVKEPSIMEKMDSHRNVMQRAGHDERVRKRAKEHFAEHEVADLVAKHGEKQAKQSGWIKPDGKLISKEDLK